MGYKTTATTLLLIPIALSATPQKLESVKVISAAGFEQNIADAPASISVISGEELSKKAYTDVLDAIKNIPGVYASGGGNNQDITIRGMSSAYTKYLVNGRAISPARATNTNGTDGGKIGAYLPPIDMIERIEIIRGPMSSLYGSEAMGGIVNIITKKGTKDKWSGSISPEYTIASSSNDVSNDEHSIGMFLSGPVIQDKLQLNIDGLIAGGDESSYSDLDAQNNKSSSPKTEKKVRKIGSEFVWDLDDQNAFDFRYDYTKQEYSATPGKSMPELNAQGNPNTPSYTNLQKDIYTIGHKGKYGSLSTDTHYSKEVAKKLQDKLLEEKLDTFKSMSTYMAGDHTITFGGEYIKESLTNQANGLLDAGVGIAVAKADRWTYSLFLEDEWDIMQDLALTAGVRFNKDEFYGSHFNPRLYGVYSLSDELTIKAGVSTGYKQPSISQSTAGFGQGTGGGTWQSAGLPHVRALMLGNPDLDPEKSVNYEAGLNYSNEDRGLFSSITFFQTEFEDKIQEFRECSTDASGNANQNNYAAWNCTVGSEKYYFVSSYDNIDKAQMRGIEFTLDYDLLESLRFSSSYTYTKSKQKSGDFKGHALNKMPEHMFNASLEYEANAQWDLWSNYNFRGKTSEYLSRVSMAKGTPSYGIWDLGVVYKATKDLSLKGGIYNVANKKVTSDEYEVVLDAQRFIIGMNLKF